MIRSASAIGQPAGLFVGSAKAQAWAYNDGSLTVAGQQQETETAKLAGPNSTVPGLGEEAVVYETAGTGDQAKQPPRLTLSIRDSDVLLIRCSSARRDDNTAGHQRTIAGVAR
ncbi:hypothetical protein [Dactylosporangium sp. NPDC051484]|uniref:hypothetical protein n=1 Tax=Dactylosporangium sp. NPDC051484 TaxID=3154942 RepID=UPI00344D9ED5